MKLDTIVVGVDGSADSLAAVAWAAGLAGRTGASVVAVHALGLLERLDGGELVASQSHRAEIETRFEAEWCAPLHELGRCRHVLRHGSAVPVLLAVADEEDADLVVVGSRGLGGHPARLLGSTSTQVAQRATRPVVIVPGALGTEHGTALGERLLLGEGRSVLVRSPRRVDDHLVASVLAELGADAVRSRFEGGTVGEEVTLLAVDDGGRAVGIARFLRVDGEPVAEPLVAVVPAWRGQGLGAKLLVLLGLRAAEQGVREFRSTYAREQAGIDRVVASSGLPHRTTAGDATTTVEIDLTGTGT